jgi:translation initiation factor 3 subunit A
MDTESLRRLQVIQLDKERGELHEKMRTTGKRIDHFERALRREEIPLLNKDYEDQLAHEEQIYKANRQKRLDLAAAKHEESIELKRRLARVLPDYYAYRHIIEEKRHEEFQARRKAANAALEVEKAKRRAAYQKYLEEQRLAEEERQRQEELEAERERQEEEERLQKEEAAQQAAAEKARIREEERRYLLHAMNVY